MKSLRLSPHRRTLPVLLTLAALLCSLGGAAAQDEDKEKKEVQKTAQKPAAAPEGPYKLRPGDEIEVSVVPQKEFDCGGILLPDGMLYLKGIGGLKAGGLTISDLRKEIVKLLDSELVDPRITVAVVRMAPKEEEKAPKIGRITVVGAVQRAQTVELEEGLRVRKALDLAGGVEKDADLTKIIILHPDLTQTKVDLSTNERLSDPAHNRLLKDGDSVEVPAKEKAADIVGSVRIRGQVLNPGSYELKTGMTVEDLIVLAGKLKPLANIQQVSVQRKDKPAQTVDLVALSKKAEGGDVLLEPGDAVFIPEHENTVLVIGAVQNPGYRPFKPGQKILDFLVGGPDSESAAALNPAIVDLTKVEITRKGQAAPLKVNLADVRKKPDHKDNLTLESGDMVFMPPRTEKTQKKGVLDYIQQISPLGFLFGGF